VNRPLTDRETIVALRAHIADLEEEVAAWRSGAKEEAQEEHDEARVDAVRRALKDAWPLAGGRQPALILLHFVAHPGRPASKSRLFALTRTRYSYAREDASRSCVEVRISHLRRALDNLGYPGVIESLRERGWSISTSDCDRIRALFAV
jgi:DNA-binding response OmpR family regulator